MRSFGPGLLFIVLSAAALSGCGGGDDESAPASGTAQPPAAPAPNPTPPPSTPTNRAPTISGTAPGAVNAATAYNFVPSSADADGDTLAFTIQNKPSWATFNTSTGRLSGTPDAADVGTYSNIRISVSDGTANAALPAFAIAVTTTADGRATLSWTAPTENTDGSSLGNLAGYRIRYGTSASSLTQTILINNASVTTFVVEDLSPATWYFAVSAVTASGTESTNSNVANKVI
jgi:Putative Ig domain